MVLQRISLSASPAIVRRPRRGDRAFLRFGPAIPASLRGYHSLDKEDWSSFVAIVQNQVDWGNLELERKTAQSFELVLILS